MALKKIIYLLFFISTINEMSYSQSVIASGVNFSNNSEGSVFWTVGEFVSETIESDKGILTQGFYQSNFISTKVNIESTDFNISVFPNPIDEQLFISCDDYDNLSFQINDLFGLTLIEGLIYNRITNIKLNNIPSSVYFLLIKKKKHIIKTFKIVKH